MSLSPTDDIQRGLGRWTILSIAVSVGSAIAVMLSLLYIVRSIKRNKKQK